MRLCALGLAIVLAVAAGGGHAADAPSIEPAEVGERLAWADRSLVLLDVRTAEEFAEGHVPGAINIPHTELAARIGELEAARGRDIVVYCRSGNRSAKALEALGEAGFRRLFHLKGDFPGWSDEGRPVARGR